MATEGQTLAVDELVGTGVDQASREFTSAPSRFRRLPWFALFTVGFAAQVAWRLYLSWPQTGPIAHPDEDGYLLAARVVGGGANAMLPGTSIMRAIGYPLLLSPIHWFVDQPADVYKGVHIINALVMALIFPLIYLLARRLFDVTRWPAIAIAFVVATLPSAVFFAEFALTDAVLPTVVLSMLLTLHGMFTPTRRAAVYGVLTGVIAGYAATTHVRGLVMLVVVAALMPVALLARWLPWRVAAAALASMSITYLAGRYANRWLESRMFADGSFDVEGRVFDRLTSLDGILRLTLDAAGQIWHLCTSTWGLAGLGLAAAVFTLIRREGPRSTRIVMAVAVVVTLGIAAATATGIPYETEQRVNNHVYGRYVAILATFWVLVAVVTMVRATLRRGVRLAVVTAAFVGVTILAVALYWGDWMRRGSYVNFDSPELSFLMNDWSRLRYFRVSAVVGGLILLFALGLPRWRRRPTRRPMTVLASITLVAVMLVNLAAMVRITHHISQVWLNRDYHSGTPDVVRDAGIRPGDTVMQANTVSWMADLRHQTEIYWQPLRSFDPTKGAPADRPQWVLASTGTGKRTDWYGWDYGYHEVLRFKDGYAGECVVWQRDTP